MASDQDLKRLKRRLGITDNLQDELLQDLLEEAGEHFKALTGSNSVEDKYAFIIRDVALIRYNRKGSEGMTSESVDGYSSSYIQQDFAQYLDLLSRDFDLDEKRRKRGKVRFL